MKISLITVSYNSEKTIERTIRSVLSQDYLDIEYIIIDGDSSDNTLDIIQKFKKRISKVISEKDSGVYDAMNRGLLLASGQIIGFLHSDDYYPQNNIISNVINNFLNQTDTKLVIGDIALLNKKKKITRYYSGSNFNFQIGIMPPHPSVFIKKDCYKKFGNFNENYKIAADYDLLLRIIKIGKIKYSYSKTILVYMQDGGISNKNIFSKIYLNKEIYNIHKFHKTPISLFNLLKKIPTRFRELLSK